MPTKEKPATRKRPAPEPGPHRMTAASYAYVRELVEAPTCTNRTLQLVFRELELVTAERDAALARLGEG